MKITGVRLFDGRRFSDGRTITIHGGRIAEVSAAGGEGAEVRALVTPGLIDSHVHLHRIALFLGEASLHDAREPSEVVARLRRTRKAGWALGNRLDHFHWRAGAGPLKRLLDEQFPETPVRVLFSDGHSAILNEAGLGRVVAWRAAGQLPSVRLETDAEGRSTGLAADGNLELALLPPSDPRAAAAGKAPLAAAAAECAAHGITAVHDLFVTVPEYLALRDAALDGLRVFAYIGFQDFDELLRLRKQLGPSLETDRLRIRGIKCFADGSLGSGGALLTRPYRSGPYEYGFEVLNTGELAGLARRCLDHRLQLAVHALGDRGVANVLDSFERAFAGRGTVDHRFRIEHAQVIRDEDIDRCRRLGVILSMQPYHFTDDARWLPERLPPELCRQVSLWRRFLEAGIPVCFGSDAPFTNLSAVDGIRAAVHRLATLEARNRRFFADEALTPAQALACYSSGAAYAVFEEDRLGAIAPGRVADLTVFDPGLERVLMTVVGGRVTFRRDEAPALLE